VTNLRNDPSTPAVARDIPDATVARLPVYLRALTALAEAGTTTCSSGDLALSVGVTPAQLRKDLSHLGSYGTRGVGYVVEHLRDEVARVIGSSQDWDVVIVGVGHLGTALTSYQGFGSRGIRIVAAVDVDPARIGTEVAGVIVEPLERLTTIVAERGIRIGVIATPGHAAQEVADLLVAAGVHSILNFAPAHVEVRAGVDLRQVDLSIELQLLAYREQRRDGATPGRIA
jgi:redox-sensing transcriptional repressor